MSISFVKRRIRVVINLRSGKFEDGTDKVIIDDLPMHVEIIRAGLPSFPEANVTIWGLKLNKMKALSMVGSYALQYYKNDIRIYAGEGDPETLPLVFKGVQWFGAMVPEGDGNVRFEMKSFTGYFETGVPKSPTTVQGTVPAADLIRQFANDAGFNFVNQGVTASVKDSIINGDNIHKMQTVANAVGANLILEDQTITLLPKNVGLDTSEAIISAETGMMGYPTLTSTGLQVTSIFRPDIRFNQYVTVKSVIPIPTSSEKHRVLKLTHSLDANTNDGGLWQTTIESLFNYGL